MRTESEVKRDKDREEELEEELNLTSVMLTDARRQERYWLERHLKARAEYNAGELIG